MKKHWSLALLAVLTLSFAVACATNTGVSEIDEATLEAAVRAKIADEVPNETAEIGVKVDGSTVTLTGRVTRNEERTKIGDAARRTEGVSRVINNIVVGPETGGNAN